MIRDDDDDGMGWDGMVNYEAIIALDLRFSFCPF